MAYLSMYITTIVFLDGRWKSAVNMVNPLGTKGNLAQAFANILRDMWQGELQCLNPVTFRVCHSYILRSHTPH